MIDKIPQSDLSAILWSKDTIMDKTKIDFLFVGYPKSGSTTFYGLLKSHPEIAIPDIKEINFFNTDHNREGREHLGANHFQLAESENEYLQYFQGSIDKIKGDVNPSYIFSTEAPQNIFKHNPETKILISLREPVSFLRSYHFQSLYNLVEDEPDFLRALSLEKSRRAGRNIPRHCHNYYQVYYSFLSSYKQHIKHFTDIFGFDKIKVLLFDDIVENEDKVYQDILRFLSVRELDFIPSKVDRNPSHALRFTRLRKIFLSPPVKKWLYTKLPKNLLPIGAGLSKMIFKKKQEKTFIAKTDIDQLKSQLSSNVIELNLFLNKTGLLNRDLLDIWDYK